MRFSVENGCFSYKNGKKLLQGINFSAEGGDITAILGPNGSGKTTLLRCAMGLLAWDGGESRLDGRSICGIPYRERWRLMAYVPQSKSAALACTAEEMVLLGRASRIGVFSGPGTQDIDTVRRVLSELGISHLAEKPCSRLSGGELQMVLIARALAAEPRVLLLDEPESNLDFRNQLLVLDTLSRLARGGMTVIFNTHYPANALQRANKALLLDGRGSSRFGTAQEVITEENIQAAFGVRTAINSLDTPDGVLWDVLPVSIINHSKEENL